MQKQQIKMQNKPKCKGKGKPGVKSNKKIGKKVFKPKQNKNKEEKLVIDKLQAKYQEINLDKVNTFADLPLSANTLKGLKACDYLKPTDIQKQTIKLALTGQDVLGAAQTGSGKTLAFLIPILERLFTKQWTRLDGIGAVVITPTRELAYQIFNTLEKLALPHRYTTGFVVGGKDLRYEWSQVGQCNIIVCTPGRLLQHMDENSSFDCVNLEVLVLDEADRCLDMGFQQTMNAIIANLPPTRQTLLFSATQTKSVKDLVRLSLKNPCYVSVHENFTYSTPEGLQQNYAVCELKDKIAMLWTFLRNNPKEKIIIFLASCKQVKYLSEIFKRMRVMKIMALYGTLHQLRRLAIYNDFCKEKSAVLFATDIAARGLDFPEVHWVVQGDCPEDAETYIHRVGRTARFHKGGKSLLLLMPSELGMLDELKEKKVPIHVMDQPKVWNPIKDMKKYLAQSSELTDTARRAFLSYVKSIVHMKNKKIFDVKALDTDSFAHSLGLVTVPKIRFLKKMMPTKNASNTKISFVEEKKEEEDVNENELVEEIATKFNKPSTHTETAKVLKSFATRLESDSDEDAEEDELDYTKLNKESHDYLQTESNEILKAVELGSSKSKIITKAAAVKKLMKKKIKPNTKLIFNDEGEAVKEGTKSKKSQLAEEYENEVSGGVDIEKSKLVLKAEDKFDKQLFKQKVQSKHKLEKKKLKDQKKKEDDKRKAQKEQEEQDEFGDDDDFGEEPDLSWLPDPDKIYAKSADDNDDNDEIPVSKKEQKKLKTKKEKKQITEPIKKRKLKDDGDEPLKRKKQKLSKIGTALNINEAEELAMIFLKK